MKRVMAALLLLAGAAQAGPWPTDNITTTHVDAATDDPSQARAEIYTTMLRVKDVIGARNSASGVAPLDASALVPLANIPATLTGKSADTLDGIDSTSFARVDAASNFTTAPTISSNTVWHAGNDGAGSGLDADLLDGLSSASFAQLSGATFTGTVASSKPCSNVNYTRVAPNICIRTAHAGNTEMAKTCTQILSPAADAKALIVSLRVVASSANAQGARSASAYFYINSPCSAQSQLAQTTANAYEFSALSNTMLSVIETTHILLQASAGASVWGLYATDGTYASSYVIRGYID